MREDLIDFPVSDDWRDYYYERGLTPYPSPRYMRGETQALHNELSQLRTEVQKLQEENYQLKATIKSILEHLKKKTPTQKSGGRKQWPATPTR